MQAVKGIYSRGKIELLESLGNVQSADLYVIVIPHEDKNCRIVTSGGIFNKETMESEGEFRQIGLAEFFDTEDDANVDWEDAFGLKNR